MGEDGEGGECRELANLSREIRNRTNVEAGTNIKVDDGGSEERQERTIKKACCQFMFKE